MKIPLKLKHFPEKSYRRAIEKLSREQLIEVLIQEARMRHVATGLVGQYKKVLQELSEISEEAWIRTDTLFDREYQKAFEETVDIGDKKNGG